MRNTTQYITKEYINGKNHTIQRIDSYIYSQENRVTENRRKTRKQKEKSTYYIKQRITQ